MLSSFYTRIVVVLILTSVLTILDSTEKGFVFTAPAAFIAGIFPDSALQAVAKFTQTSVLGRFAIDSPSDLEAV
jgi:hypothetical protein